MDEMGNLIYRTQTGTITFVKYDEQGNPIKDLNGKIIYFDKDNNTYNENNRGSKIKQSGHQLDRLIEMLSFESRLLLETRMLKIPMESTEKNKSVSILDVLLEKGILSQENQISKEEYVGWIEQHKKAFEESRYSGEKKYDVSVEFLYHLATQIKAVAQYKINPMNNQKFTVTDSELAQLPKEIEQIMSFHSHLMSEDLIKLIANNQVIRDRVIMLFSNPYIIPTKNVSPLDFYNMIRLMNNDEIIYVSYLSYMVENYQLIVKDNLTNEAKKTYEIAGIFITIGVQPNKIIGLLVETKEIFGKDILINNESIGKLLKVLRDEVASHYNHLNNYKDVYGYNPKDYINYINNNKYKI